MSISCRVDYPGGNAVYDFEDVPRVGDYVVLPAGLQSARFQVQAVAFLAPGIRPQNIEIQVSQA